MIRKWWAAISDPPAADPPDDRLQLGHAAKRLLEDPVLKLALDKIEDDLAATWRATKVNEREAREAAYQLHWAVEGLRSRLTAMLGDAKVIEAEHQRREEAARREAERRQR